MRGSFNSIRKTQKSKAQPFLTLFSKRRQISWVLFSLLLVCNASSALAQSTVFTYQGRLMDAGAPSDGHYDFQFTLWNGLTGGAQQPQPSPLTVAKDNVPVTGGIFSVALDFGASAFSGGDRFLEIAARPHSTDPNATFTTLAPRQPVAATPYAIRALTAGKADTTVNAQQLGGVVASGYVKTSDSLSGDVTGALSATVVSSVGGHTASSINTAVTAVSNATNLNNANAIVKRDASGNFIAGTIFATTFNGNATTATTATTASTATNFSGNLAGNVTGTQGATVVSAVGGKTAVQVSTSVDDTTSATPNNSANSIIKRNASGNFTAGTITANLNGNAATANTATNFSGNLSGDVAGQQGTTSIQPNAVTAAKIASNQVVKSVNGLKDSVTLAGNGGITITPAGNTLTFSLTGTSLRRSVWLFPSPGGVQYTLNHNLGTLDVIVQVYRQDDLGRWLQIRLGENGQEVDGFVFITGINTCLVGLFEAGTYRVVIIG